jgi:CrcB protein
MIKQLILVGIGGAAGSMMRFAVSYATSKLFAGSFPAATFIVNITGCFLIGLFIAQLPVTNNALQWRMLLVTGFCGGYTTFSAFAYENLQLFNNNQSLVAVGYIFASVLLGIAAVWLGLKTG